MALQPNLTSYLRNISVKNARCFAAAAKPKESSKVASSGSSSSFVAPEQVQTTRQGGVTVSTQETNRPLSKLAVYYKAGSRYQQGNDGVVHALRNAAGLGTAGATRFGITRTVEAAGGNLSCTVGREHIAYTLEATSNTIEKLEQILVDVASKQVFKPWEVHDAVPQLRYDLNTLAPEVRVLDLIHQAAFRKGLGYSLYSPRSLIGKQSPEMLQDFVQKNFIEASVVGVGVSNETASRIAKRLKVKPGERSCVTKAEVYSTEIRKDTGGDFAYVALAIQGSGLGNPKEMMASAIAQRALGSAPRSKRGNTVGKLASVSNDYSSVSAFSANYSDAGILGVFIVGSGNAISDLTKKSAEILKNATFKEDEVSRAKNALKADLAFVLDSESDFLDDLGLQSLFTGKVTSYGELVQLIDSVTASDVNNVIKNGRGKLSSASLGNLADVPYLDQL